MTSHSLIKKKYEEFLKAKQSSLFEFEQPDEISTPPTEKKPEPAVVKKPVQPTLNKEPDIRPPFFNPAEFKENDNNVALTPFFPSDAFGGTETVEKDPRMESYYKDGKIDYTSYFYDLLTELPRGSQFKYNYKSDDPISRLSTIPKNIRDKIMINGKIDNNKLEGWNNAHKKWLREEKTMAPQRLFAGLVGGDMNSEKTKTFTNVMTPLTGRGYLQAVSMTNELSRNGMIPKRGEPKQEMTFRDSKGNKYMADISRSGNNAVITFQFYDRVTNKPKYTKRRSFKIPIDDDKLDVVAAVPNKVKFYMDELEPLLTDEISDKLIKIPEYKKMMYNIAQNIKLLKAGRFPRLTLDADKEKPGTSR